MITGFLDTKNYPEILHRLQRTEIQLRNFGIGFPNGCRWQTYGTILGKVCRGARLSVKESRLLPECLLECESFTFAIESLATPPATVGWEEAAREAAGGGQESSVSEAGNTHPRNRQSELLIAALLRRGGLEVEFGGPDLLLTLSSGVRLAVAVKRVKSATELRNRTRQARKQLIKGSLDGITALDLGFFRNSEISAPDLGSAGEKLRQETEEYTLRNRELLITAAKKGGHTIGIMVATAKMAYLENAQEAAAVFSLYVLTNESDDRQRMVDEVVAAIVESGAVWFNRRPAADD